ncbi:MAG: Uma2 family endonuclease [Chloroflexi bacterium]|nr:Uma2 family endonuclease [Chloroflexota bacterium]
MTTQFDQPLVRHPAPQPGEPVWEVANFFPRQGYWTETEYLRLTESHNWLMELCDGYLEILTPPTLTHQRVVGNLLVAMSDFVEKHQAGKILPAPLPVKFGSKHYREPDLMYFSSATQASIKGDYPHTADLVVEVVSEGKEDRERDLVTKREVYAEASIAEYWIVDPKRKRITVLTLDRDKYIVHGEFAPGTQATSVLLSGFALDVQAVFAAAE